MTFWKCIILWRDWHFVWSSRTKSNVVTERHLGLFYQQREYHLALNKCHKGFKVPIRLFGSLFPVSSRELSSIGVKDIASFIKFSGFPAWGNQALNVQSVLALTNFLFPGLEVILIQFNQTKCQTLGKGMSLRWPTSSFLVWR